MDTQKNSLRKYAFSVNKGGSARDAAYKNNRRLLGEVTAPGMTPDDIFNEQLKDMEIVEDYTEVDKFYNSDFWARCAKPIIFVTTFNSFLQFFA